MKRSFCLLLTLTVLFVSVSPFLSTKQACAETEKSDSTVISYVEEIMILWADKSVPEYMLWQQLKEKGYNKVVDCKIADGYDNFTRLLGYKTTDIPDDAIRTIIYVEDDSRTDDITRDGISYSPVLSKLFDSDTQERLPLYSNGASYLYYSKDKSLGEPLTEILLSENESEEGGYQVMEAYAKQPLNIVEGVKNVSPVYLHIKVKGAEATAKNNTVGNVLLVICGCILVVIIAVNVFPKTREAAKKMFSAKK